jgi:hypothetical protein
LPAFSDVCNAHAAAGRWVLGERQFMAGCCHSGGRRVGIRKILQLPAAGMTATGQVAEEERLTSRRERIAADTVGDSRRCETE